MKNIFSGKGRKTMVPTVVLIASLLFAVTVSGTGLPSASAVCGNPDAVDPTTNGGTVNGNPTGSPPSMTETEAQVQFQGNASDDCEVAWVKVKIFDGVTNEVIEDYEDAIDFSEPEEQPFSTWLFDYTFAEPGYYKIQIKVQDVTGNNDHYIFFLTMDITGCDPDIVDPAVTDSGDDTDQDPVYIISGTTSDNCLINWVKVKVFNYPSMTVVSQYQDAADTTSDPGVDPLWSTWEYEIALDTATGGSGEGTYLFQSKVEDEDGNWQWDQAIITIDLP
jgi:hypothetical protein